MPEPCLGMLDKSCVLQLLDAPQGPGVLRAPGIAKWLRPKFKISVGIGYYSHSQEGL